MKPSGQLARTVPLQRRTRLVGDPAKDREWRHRSQQTAITRARCPKPRTASAPKKKPNSSRAGEGKARDLVYARSGGWCEVQLPGTCYGRAASWHHRLNRSQGGRWLASHGLHTCGSGSTGCHGALTNPPRGHRAEFEHAGWITTEDPAGISALIPVELVPWRHALPEDQTQVRVLLTDDGRYLPAREET